MAAKDARRNAVTRNTDKEHDRAWKRWTTFLRSIEITDDEYLKDFSVPIRTRLLSVFAQSIRSGEHSPKSRKTLASNTVRAAVDNVAQAFRDCQFKDPRLDETGKLSRLLSRQ